MKPLARKDKLTIRELSDETVVYDLERHTMHCLNRTSMLVWQHCDGQHDEAALAELLSQELQLPAEEAAAAVRLALEQLSRRQLLQEQVAPAQGEERLTRRKALRKMAVAAAAAIPLVMTLRSPSVAWAAHSCTNATDCPDQTCKTATCNRNGGVPAIFGPHNSRVVTKTAGFCEYQSMANGTACLGNTGRCVDGNCVSGCGQEGQSCTANLNGNQGTCCNGCECLNGSCSCG
jgi:hypothetical protein